MLKRIGGREKKQEVHEPLLAPVPAPAQVNVDEYPKLGACFYYFPYGTGYRLEKVGPGLVNVGVWEYNGYHYVIGYLGRKGMTHDDTPMRALAHPKPKFDCQKVKVLIEGNRAYQYFGLPADHKPPHGFFNIPYQGVIRTYEVIKGENITPWRPADNSSSSAQPLN